MRDDASASGSQRGQALILAMLAMTVIFIIGAIVVDFGLWLSERRGAQTDADFVALAGAWELLNPNGDPVAAANDSLAANNEQGNATPGNLEIVDGRCFTADVQHESRSLFAGIFGIFAPEIGAHAKACAGATNAPLGTIPVEINTSMADCFESDGTPKFGSICPLDFDANGSNPRGLLDLDARDDYCSDSAGSGNLYNLIEWGATGTCLISETGSCNPATEGPWYDCVAVQNGNPTRVMRAVEQRVSREGACDRDRDGTEEFPDEIVEVVFSGSPGVYQARDCDPATQGAQISPRLASVIILDGAPASGDTGNPIHAFASMYIEGCSLQAPSQTPPDLQADCTGWPPGSGGNGHAIVYGRLVNLIVENSGTGQPSTSTTSFSISLEE